MTTRPAQRRAFLQLLVAACVVPIRGLGQSRALPTGVTIDEATASYHVFPKGRIQDALEAAARDPVNKTVFVHAGTYRPPARGQALIWFNARHDGITLEAVGDVTLTAANPEIADSDAPELSRGRQPRRLFRRRRVAKDRSARLQDHRRPNNFTTGSGEKSPIESDDIRKTPFFYTDGGGHQGLRAVVSDDRARRGLRELHEPVRRRRVGRASRPGAGVGALPQLHLPRQPHADDRIRLRPPARQPRRHRELPLRRQHRQPGRRLRRAAGRRRVSRRARLRRLDRVRRLDVRPSAGARSPATGTASTTTAPAAPTSTGSSGRTRSPAGFQQGLATSSTSPTAPACAARSFTARSTICAERSTKDRTRSIRPDPRFDAQFAPQAPQYHDRRLPACEGSGGRAGPARR